MSNVSGTLKTEADLLRVNEVRDLGNMLLALHSDIIKNAHYNLQERIESKAIVLQRQKIQPRLIKVEHFVFFFEAIIFCFFFLSILVKVCIISLHIKFIFI